MLKYLNYGWLNRVSDDALIVAINAILEALTGNTSFPSPAPTLVALRALLASFLSALSAAKEGGKLATQLKNDARLALVVAVQDLAQSLEDTADGDLTALLSTKYPLIKTRGPVGIQPAPSNLRLKQGPVSGSVIARCDTNPAAPIFEWAMASGATPTNWENQAPTKCASFTATALVPGTVVQMRVRQRVPAGVSDWSAICAMIVI